MSSFVFVFTVYSNGAEALLIINGLKLDVNNMTLNQLDEAEQLQVKNEGELFYNLVQVTCL